MRKCFELIAGNSAKFWTCEVIGKHYLATFGRIGTQGQTKIQTFATALEATEKANAMIAEKISKGYRQVDDYDHAGAKCTLLDSLAGTATEPATQAPAPRRPIPRPARKQPAPTETIEETSAPPVMGGSGRRIVPLA